MTEGKEVKERSDINKPAMHFVCTLDEAKDLSRNYNNFWVMNCGCREEYGKGKCKSSRIDVCLTFYNVSSPWGSNMHEITKTEMEEILSEAVNKKLVARPFRDEKTRSYTEGICFCCDCCCGYFRMGNETCDKGNFIESTDMDNCTHCGLCVDVCYFKARLMVDGEHSVDREKCYGCGLCIKACPEDCIEMIER